jgi:alpha-1,3-rhamnosyl/mannosyltransferase
LEYPENFSIPKKLFLSKAIPAAIKRSNVICVTSKFVADSLLARFDIPENSIRIIKPSITAPESAIGRSGIETPFVLFPAVTWPHKGHKFLIKVMELTEPDVTLVLTGSKGQAHSEVMQCIRNSKAANRIVHLGSVTSTRLEALYADALALVFPSEYEGFGQPLIEAMARGCPVISSDQGAIPETVGNGGLTLPRDELIWAEEISQLKNKSHRENLKKRGLLRSKQFTSTEAAASQVAVYNSVIAL